MPRSAARRTETTAPVRYCLVTDDAAVEAALRVSCPLPHEILSFPLEGLVASDYVLSAAGREVISAARSAGAVLVSWRFDLAPDINTLCFHVRKELLAPVIALCRGGQEELIAALAAGADDALTFPLYAPHLHARTFAYRRLVDAAGKLARSGRETGHDIAAEVPGDTLTFGPLTLDRDAHRFFVRGEEVELTPREFALLSYLIRHHGSLCTRDQILDGVWGINFDTGTNMVDVYTYFIRRKLEARGVTGIIQTVRGRGYRLVLPENAPEAALQ